jgi:hypothetical protein
MSKFIFIKPANLRSSTSYSFKEGDIVKGTLLTPRLDLVTGQPIGYPVIEFNSNGLVFRISLEPNVINPYIKKGKYQFASSVNLTSLTPTSFNEGTIIDGNLVNLTRNTPMGGTMTVPTINFKYNGLDYLFVNNLNNPIVKSYNLKDISNNKSMEYSNANGDEKNNSLLKYSIIGLVSIGAIYGLSKLIK